MSSVLETVTASAENAGAVCVTEIHLVVGEMTEAVAEALEFAFEVLTPGTLCENARLDFRFVTPRSLCLECGEEFSHDRFHLKCPKCGSSATTLLEGRDLYIDSIEVEMPDDADDTAEESK